MFSSGAWPASRNHVVEMSRQARHWFDIQAVASQHPYVQLILVNGEVRQFFEGVALEVRDDLPVE
jgi:hypothetical protein